MHQPITSKTIPLNRLGKIVARLKKEGKKIVHCHGVFDLIHPGHIRYFESAKALGDVLVVTITGDKFVKKGPGRPFFNESLRSEVLSSLQMVDYVAVVKSPNAILAINIIKPTFYVKGPDYKHRKPNPLYPRKLGDEEIAVKAGGGTLKYTDDEVVFSSSHLINRYLESYPSQTQKYLKKIRESYRDKGIFEMLVQIKTKKILVIGDAIIDQYHYTLPMGKSSKEPLVVHIYRGEESFAGGALATANHLAALSDHVHLITLLGKKLSFVGFIKQHLQTQVKPIFFYQDDAPSIIKRRFIDEVTKQKLFQVSYMKDEAVTSETEGKILNFLRTEITNFDLVVVNDFGHGLMSPKIIRLICKKAKYVALNVQANSANYGFNIVTKYPRADFVCMDEQELRLATHDKYSNLLKLVKRIAKKLNCNELIVTRGSIGCLSYTKGEGIVESPALSQLVVDRIGAGDAFFAITAPCAYIGMDQTLVSFIGNVAGALKVQSVGNKTPIDNRDLTKFIVRLLK